MRSPAKRLSWLTSTRVVGGRTTGVLAALAVARLGAGVALVERQACFGGSATASLVCVWHSPMDSVFERQIVGGLPTELMDRLNRRRAVSEYRASSSYHYVFSPSGITLVLDCMVGEAEDRIRPFLRTQFATAITDGEGRRQVRAMLDILHAHVPGGEQVTLQGLPARNCRVRRDLSRVGCLCLAVLVGQLFGGLCLKFVQQLLVRLHHTFLDPADEDVADCWDLEEHAGQRVECSGSQIALWKVIHP